MRDAMERIVRIVRRYWRLEVPLLGGGTIGALIIAYLQDKIMEWAVANGGVVGRWFVANPSSLLTAAVVVCLVVVLSAFVDASRNKDSTILSESGHSLTYRRVGRGYSTVIVVVALLVMGAVVQGQYRYMHRTRARLYAANVLMHADSSVTSVKFDIINGGRSIVFRHLLVNTAVFTADSQYAKEASGEGKLFDWGPEWHRKSVDIPLGASDLLNFDMNLPPLRVQPWFWLSADGRLRDGRQELIYFLAEISGRDEVGPLGTMRGCWFTTVEDQDHPKPCVGSYALQGN